MELLLLLGLALFLILVSAIFFLIFRSGAALAVMAMIIICAIGFGVFMALASVIYPKTGDIDTTQPDISMYETVISGGVERSIPTSKDNINLPTISTPKIINLKICADETMPCKTTLDNPDIYIYWQVQGGVGCCNNFGCNYQLFQDFCGSPFDSFNLYDISLDGEQFDWSTVTHDNYEWNYTCSDVTPWNYFWYNDVNVGPHEIKIVQKDCMITVDTKIITFNLEQSGTGYIITNQRIK